MGLVDLALFSNLSYGEFRLSTNFQELVGSDILTTLCSGAADWQLMSL
jgi:hypothetical protein